MKDVISIIESQGLKKKVKVLFINELSYDKITTDERRLKQIMLNFLINILYNTQKGFIIIRASMNQKQLETIKISIYNSGKHVYPIAPKAKLKLNTIDDIILARKNKDCLQQSINQQIIGRLGPYDKVNITNRNISGCTLQFSIYADLKILDSPRKIYSQEELDLQFQSGFKSVGYAQQEGEISQNSSYDASFAMNKLIVENINQINGKQFFPSSQLSDVATMDDKDEHTFQQSSKNKTIKKNSFYTENQSEKQNHNYYQDTPLHPATHQMIQKQQFEKNNLSHYLDMRNSRNNNNNNRQLDDQQNGQEFNKSDNSKHIDQIQNFFDDQNGFGEAYDQDIQNSPSKKNMQRQLHHKNSGSIFSHTSKDNRSTANYHHNKIQYDNNNCNVKKLSNYDSKQSELTQRQTIESSKCFLTNPFGYEQSDENFSPRRDFESIQAIQSHQGLQASVSSQNIKQIIQVVDLNEISQKQKHEISGYYEIEKNDSKFSINQFSSRQFNIHSYITNDEPININQNQLSSNHNQQKLNLIKLRQSNSNESNTYDYYKISPSNNITSLKHIL